MTRYIDANALRTIRSINSANFNSIETIQEWIDAQPTIDAEPHWIPCSERLPEDDRSKVVTLANGNAEVGYYSNGDWWCVGDKLTLENPTVIAWMPLPKPYPYEGDKE